MDPQGTERWIISCTDRYWKGAQSSNGPEIKPQHTTQDTADEVLKLQEQNQSDAGCTCDREDPLWQASYVLPQCRDVQEAQGLRWS